jgi:hypothetical protein
MSTHKFNLKEAFRNLEDSLRASYEGMRAVTNHPGTKGNELEADWIGLVSDFLPSRYEVGPIFAIDHEGNMSDQIDLAIYDRHFSPQWFGTKNGVSFVPVESVYAVFEIKPVFNEENLIYAREKVESVRVLKRTSVSFPHAGGHFKRIDPDDRPILGGLLTTKSGWAATKYQQNLQRLLPSPNALDHLDIGVAMDQFAFDFLARYGEPDEDGVMPRTGRDLCFSQPDQHLVHFVVRLFRQLQAVGSVLAIDMAEYERAWLERSE